MHVCPLMEGGQSAESNSTALPLCSVGLPHAEGRQQLVHWPFATKDLYNWKLQNPKFSEKPSKLIDLLDSVLFIHQTGMIVTSCSRSSLPQKRGSKF